MLTPMLRFATRPLVRSLLLVLDLLEVCLLRHPLTFSRLCSSRWATFCRSFVSIFVVLPIVSRVQSVKIAVAITSPSSSGSASSSLSNSASPSSSTSPLASPFTAVSIASIRIGDDGVCTFAGCSVFLFLVAGSGTTSAQVGFRRHSLGLTLGWRRIFTLTFFILLYYFFIVFILLVIVHFVFI